MCRGTDHLVSGGGLTQSCFIPRTMAGLAAREDGPATVEAVAVMLQEQLALEADADGDGLVSPLEFHNLHSEL